MPAARPPRLPHPHAPLRAALCLFLLALLQLQACAGGDPRQAARALGASRGFAETLYPTPYFILYGQFRPGTGDVLRAYIEGDGHAWQSRTRPSTDPTPHNPVGLRLALADPSPAPLLYLARPCQYARGEALRHCATRYWTSARLSEEVISSLDAAVSAAKAHSGARHVALVGFSGGGGAAALLAARRRDVVFLGSMAGNLHLSAWTGLHRLSPLSESLEPFAVAPALHDLPQRHLSSRSDKAMPPELSAGFCRAARQPESCRVVEGIPHSGPWTQAWDYTY